MEKTRGIQLSFAFIFSVILVAVILFVSIFLIYKFIEHSKSLTLNSAIYELKNEIDSIVGRFGGAKKKVNVNGVKEVEVYIVKVSSGNAAHSCSRFNFNPQYYYRNYRENNKNYICVAPPRTALKYVSKLCQEIDFGNCQLKLEGGEEDCLRISKNGKIEFWIEKTVEEGCEITITVTPR